LRMFVLTDQRGRVMLLPRRIHVREQLNKIATIGG